jgi:atrazine chlorohydrolase/5-methylthioadenosine/S-adenosylhomocysteine deaminase/melamine deaminase
MDPTHRVLENGFVGVQGDKIADIGVMTKLVNWDANKVIDAKRKLVMPGLVNVHSHGSAVLLRGGLSQDRSLYDWMINVLYPGVMAYTLDDIRIGVSLFLDEAIRSGITTLVDNEGGSKLENHKVILDVFKRSGSRAIYGRMFNDLRPPASLADYYKIMEAKSPNVHHAEDYLVEDTQHALNGIEDLIKEYNSEDNLIQVWPSPHGPLWCTEQGLLGSLQLARRYDIGLTIHLAETAIELRHFGVSTTEYLDSIKFLDPRLLVAHFVWVNDRDIRLLKRNNVRVAHQPTSNMYLASGFAPIPKILAEGITVGLGSDDANCNDSVSIINEMRAAALIHKANTLDASCVTAEQVTEMATIGGAKAVGMNASIGSLEVGKKADIIILDLKSPHLRPIHHLPSVLVYQARGTEVETVLVNGMILMEDRKLTWMSEDDETELLDQAQAASTAVKDRAHLELPEKHLIDSILH